VTRWGHGHSTLLGIIIGGVLLLGWVLVWALTLTFGAGLALGRLWDHVRAFLRRGLPVIDARRRW